MIERCSLHALPRAGADESEDAFSGPIDHGDAQRLAIADGATESMYAREWARLLVEFAARHPLDEAIPVAREEFSARASPDWGSLAWYAQEKVIEGAHAAILALEVRAGGTYVAEAVGDCVLFQIRRDEPVRIWPIDDPSGFNNHPPLVRSTPGTPLPEIARMEDSWVAGDAFLLATDALAAHLLTRSPIEVMGLDEQGFEAFVRDARQAGMRNDDVTLAEIRLA